MRTEKVFNCEILSEDQEFVRVKFKGDIYKIPKEEVLFLNKDVEPKFESYTISKVLLPDGAIVQGRIIAEDSNSITIENSEESVAVPKSSIVKIERGTEEFASIPEKFLVEKKTESELKNEYGFYFSIFKNDKQFFVPHILERTNIYHKNSIILGGYFELEKLKFKFIQTGFDFFIHSGNNFDRAVFLTSVGYYINLKKEFYQTHFLYLQLGPNIGYLNLILDYKIKKSLGLFGYSCELGYQKVFAEDYQFKLGFNYVEFEKGTDEFISYGPKLSIGKKF